MLFQSSTLSGGRDVLKQLEKNAFKAFALSASVMILTPSTVSDGMDDFLPGYKILDHLPIPL